MTEIAGCNEFSFNQDDLIFVRRRVKVTELELDRGIKVSAVTWNVFNFDASTKLISKLDRALLSLRNLKREDFVLGLVNLIR